MSAQDFIVAMQRWQTAYSVPHPVSELSEAQLASITCPIQLFAGNTPDEVHHISAAESVKRLLPQADLRPSAWTQAEWDIIGQHDRTFPGIAATHRYAMKATFYADQLLAFIARVEAQH